MNSIAIVIAAIASFAVGAFWYSPLLFGNTWMKLMGITKKNIDKVKQKGMIKEMAVAFVMNIIMVSVLSYLLSMGAVSVLKGVHYALLIWVGFLMTTMMDRVLWEQKPLKLYLINATHYLVSLVIAGAILGAWP